MNRHKVALLAPVCAIASVLCTTAVAQDAHINSNDVDWTHTSDTYLGSDFAKAFRYKTLVGNQGAPLHAQNVYFGEAQLAPGAIYVGHAHPAPEIYYIIEGTAKWSVGAETFTATAGSTVYTKPNAVHRMENIGTENLKTVWMWWGDAQTINQFPKITEPAAKQPNTAQFVE